jgi:PAS domain S-box-containing protein
MDNRFIEAIEALQEQDEKIHALFDIFPQMIWTANPNGALDYVNAPFNAYTGWQPGKAPEKEWLSIIHEDDHALSLERWSHSLETGKPYEVEHRIRRASDGAYIWHVVRAVPVRDQQGAIKKWIGTSVDIHYLKQIEEQLSRFVYIASHDLKAPVNNMKSLVELFKIQEKKDWDKLLELLEASTIRLDETLQNIVTRVKVPDQPEAGRF